ncbi:MAG: hypothetical protein J5I93_27970 [Pirellulaceae bacterium]|nr:hypothetical protein [Pirellulaceae bacterium]
MRSFLSVLPFIALTFICWGNYGPLMHEGQLGMGKSSFRPFICVGLAYFLIAVVVPLLILRTQGEKGRWTLSGTIWSLVAGAVGAVGALGIILAFKFRGDPVYVMPLVFGCAPVVNTFVSMLMTRTFKEANLIFYAGVVIVALGAAGVMFFKPAAVNIVIEPPNAGPDTPGPVTVTQISAKDVFTKSATASSFEELRTNPDYAEAYKLFLRKQGPSPSQFLMVLGCIAMTALCWGSYGVVLHQGQAKMQGSRMRPFLCVGLAYFAIAVVAPLVLLGVFDEPGEWMPDGKLDGILWSLGAGAAGAIGALGIILAFNFGGKPIYVMPLVFGCAPVVNTFTTAAMEGTFGKIGPWFLGSLMLVILGAVTVLVFAPRAPHKPPGSPSPGSKAGGDAHSREAGAGGGQAGSSPVEAASEK